MAWAIFHEAFRFDRRPSQAVAFDIRPGADPQNLPKYLIDAAVAAGKARRVQSPKSAATRAHKRASHQTET